jgi:shikimate 5-dehydrogenase
MLVAQAVGQFEAWTGVAAPVEEMTGAALAAMAETRASATRARHEEA